MPALRGLSRIFKHCTWYRITADVKRVTSTRTACQQAKRTRSVPSKDFDLEVGNVMDQVSVDVCGPFAVSRDGNTALLVAVDHFSRWVEAYALPDQIAETCARVLYDNLFTRFGCCRVLHSDNGPRFASDLFRELCMLFDIKKTFTSPFHPGGNSCCERCNRTILAPLRPKLVVLYRTAQTGIN